MVAEITTQAPGMKMSKEFIIYENWQDLLVEIYR